jgi:hypothetical protein
MDTILEGFTTPLLAKAYEQGFNADIDAVNPYSGIACVHAWLGGHFDKWGRV